MKSIIIIFFLVSFSEEQHNSKEGAKIVGGIEVDIKDYPYQVAVMFPYRMRCGGSIISLDWILTAAHCVQNKSVDLINVRVGSTYHKSGGVIYQVVKMITHKKFLRKTLDYDIALLRLNSSITAENTQVIPLPPPGNGPPERATLVITGWGRLTRNESVSAVLRMVEVPVLSQRECQRSYSEGSKNVTDRMFCAGYSRGGKGTCKEDSGGPTVIEGVQYGIVSWGTCAKPHKPSVYTNVAVLRKWIDESCEHCIQMV